MNYLQDSYLKKICICSLFLCIYGMTTAQNKWATSFSTHSGIMMNLVEECGDTIIGDKLYARLLSSFQSRDRNSGVIIIRNIDTLYQRISGDSVLIRNQKAFSDEYLLYNYGLQQGDSIEIAVRELLFTSANFAVDSTSTQFIANESRKFIYLSNSQRQISDTWVEGIGSTKNGYLFPGWPLVADLYQTFNFYYNASARAIWSPPNVFPRQNTELELFCQDLDFNSSDLQISIFPNPFNDVLIIEHLPFNLSVEILDLSGRKIKDIHLTGLSNKLDTTDLPAGAYLVRILRGKQIINIRKVIKL